MGTTTADRSFGGRRGIGTDRKQKESNLMLTFLHTKNKKRLNVKSIKNQTIASKGGFELSMEQVDDDAVVASGVVLPSFNRGLKVRSG